MEATDKIRDTGLKVTTQRKAVYEVIMKLRHASIETIISHLQSKWVDITISTVYQTLGSFHKYGSI